MQCLFRDIHSTLLRTVAPATEPVSLAEAKSHVDAEADDWDDQFDSWIIAAREMVEEDAELSLVEQTWKLTLDRWPGDWIELRRPPVTSVSSITYVDAAGDTQTWSSSNYIVDTNGFPARISRAYATSWPVSRIQVNSINVTFVAGYSTVPQLAKQAMLLLIGHWFSNREAVFTGSITKEIELAYEAIIRRLKWDL